MDILVNPIFLAISKQISSWIGFFQECSKTIANDLQPLLYKLYRSFSNLTLFNLVTMLPLESNLSSTSVTDEYNCLGLTIERSNNEGRD